MSTCFMIFWLCLCFIQFLNNCVVTSQSCFVSIVLKNSGMFLKYAVTCAKKHSYHFCIHHFPFCEWLAVQIWIIPRNSIKQTKSNSYSKHFYNCARIEHVGIHSVGTKHKKFGWKKEKNKNILCRVSRIWHSAKHSLLSACRGTLDTEYFVECQILDTRQSIF
jgi:hypothetical protein